MYESMSERSPRLRGLREGPPCNNRGAPSVRCRSLRWSTACWGRAGNRHGIGMRLCAIVVSILLAFSIDAGWDEIQERRAEQGVLAGLQRDFVSNQTQLSNVVAAHPRRAEAYSRFRSSSPDEVCRAPPDSANSIYTGLRAPRTFEGMSKYLVTMPSSVGPRTLEDVIAPTGRAVLLQWRVGRTHTTSEGLRFRAGHRAPAGAHLCRGGCLGPGVNIRNPWPSGIRNP